MDTENYRNVYPPRRGGSGDQTPTSAQPGRGQPVEQARVDDHLPRRGKPATDPTAPPRRPHPDSDDLPSRRAQPVQQHREVADAESPRRGGPLSVSTATPRRSERAVEADDPPLRRTSTSISAPQSRPPQAASPAAPADEVATAEGGSKGTTFTTGSDASEMEVILKMFEAKISTLDVSARDLHTLASLIAMLGLHVSRLAKQKDEAGKHSSVHNKADNPPELED